MQKRNFKDFIYNVLDRLSDSYATEVKKARHEKIVKDTIQKMTKERDSKSIKIGKK